MQKDDFFWQEYISPLFLLADKGEYKGLTIVNQIKKMS